MTEETKTGSIGWLAVLGLVLTVAIATWAWLHWAVMPDAVNSYSKVAALGSALAPIAALISAIALVAAVVSVRLQQRELELQRQELRDTRAVLAEQTAEQARLAKAQAEANVIASELAAAQRDANVIARHQLAADQLQMNLEAARERRRALRDTMQVEAVLLGPIIDRCAKENRSYETHMKRAEDLVSFAQGELEKAVKRFNETGED